MSWLDEILYTHKELESPLMFWKWSALASISAVVKDNVWFHKQIYNVYPNIYVMLHADSGVKKGPPVNMAKRFVTAVNNTQVISGRSSIQGILKQMGTAHSQPGGKIATLSKVFICSSELTSSIVEDKVATTILTDLYDRNYNDGDWKSLLKMESFSLKDPCVTMLTASNEAHTSDFFVRQDMQGGYFARTFIIYERRSSTVNSLMFPLENPPNEKNSIEYLRKIALLKGQFEMSHSDRVFFDDWYKSFRHSISTFDDNTGTLNRFDDSVLKVAMLLSLSEKPELFITRTAIEQAVDTCEKLVGNVRKVTIGKGGKSQWLAQKTMIIEELIKRDGNSITQTQLNKQFWMHGTANEFHDIMTSLEMSGFVNIERMGNQIVYRMPPKAVIEWVRFLEGKN